MTSPAACASNAVRFIAPSSLTGGEVLSQGSTAGDRRRASGDANRCQQWTVSASARPVFPGGAAKRNDPPAEVRLARWCVSGYGMDAINGRGQLRRVVQRLGARRDRLRLDHRDAVVRRLVPGGSGCDWISNWPAGDRHRAGGGDPTRQRAGHRHGRDRIVALDRSSAVQGVEHLGHAVRLLVCCTSRKRWHRSARSPGRTSLLVFRTCGFS